MKDETGSNPEVRSRGLQILALGWMAVSCASLIGLDPGYLAVGSTAPTPDAGPPENDRDASVPPDPSTPPPVPAANPDCAGYCVTVTTACRNEDQNYASELECLALCSHYIPTGPRANSLECRATEAAFIAMATEGPTIPCTTAGRTGVYGSVQACGTACEAYCQLMASICPGRFDTPEACASECRGLPDRGNFNARLCSAGGDEKDGDSLQCRMWHVGAAALALANQSSEWELHCNHSAGLILPCRGERDATCAEGLSAASP